jgi:hypothetical protein
MTESKRAISEYLARGGKVVRVLPGSYRLDDDARSAMEQGECTIDIAGPNNSPATSAGFSPMPSIGPLLQNSARG